MYASPVVCVIRRKENPMIFFFFLNTSAVRKVSLGKPLYKFISLTPPGNLFANSQYKRCILQSPSSNSAMKGRSEYR